MKGENRAYRQLSDEELVQGIVHHKDEQMFAELYDRYANIIYNKGFNFIGSEEEARDTTHDIFVKLFLKLPSYKGEAKFSTWLYSFVYNFYVNYVRRKLNKEKEIFVSIDKNMEAYAPVADEEIYNLKSDKLSTALNQLEVDDKAILLMKYQDDFTIREIQEVFEIGESAVKMRLNRAKARVIEKYNAL